MIFKCFKCKEVFEADGVQIVVHEKTVGRVCPACMAGAGTIQLVLQQKSPGQPYTLGYVETIPRDGFTE
jgi:hypothetical protein